MRFVEESGRWVVMLRDGDGKKLKPDNLEPLDGGAAGYLKRPSLQQKSSPNQPRCHDTPGLGWLSPLSSGATEPLRPMPGAVSLRVR